MTSTTLMPVRVSLRRESNVHPPDQLDPEPPAKRPRLQHPSSRRRKSSPDLLDTTTTTENSSSAASPYKLSPHPLRRRTSTRRPLASNPTGSPATPRPADRRILRNETPTIAPASLYLRGGRESPDPLDTISPAATTKSSVSRRLSPAGRPSASAAAAASSSARRPRRSAPATDPDLDPVTPVSAQQEASALSASNPSQSSHEATAQQSTPTEQPSAAREQRRSLRSHDGGSRARSELAQYFPNYEELISLEPPKPEFLTGSTTIKLIDDLPEPLIPSSDPDIDTDTPFGNPLLNLHNCETISLPDPTSLSQSDTTTTESSSTAIDPLSEEIYFRPHRRNERQEKQLRNIERDHNQYEKQKLDRLLDDLQGHDWLRPMGITGHITDQERKHYETKRAHFIQEISAVLQKFKIWKEEEKRRKLEKDNKLIEEENKDHTPETNDEEGDDGDNNNGVTTLSDVQSYGGDPPDPNDVDAWAARQLHQEARSATTNPTSTTGKKSKPSTSKKPSSTTMPPPPAPVPHLPPLPLEPEKPFTSFFSKPHLRELALSSTNRKGRTRLAFGHALPDMDEREFELPAEILTPEAIDSCRRKRRRMKRASRGDTETG
ncbi:acetyltransferase SAS4-like domain-containing protein [Aspergillus ibericus CBS 121593]|uniref:Something about silencing protein 4 domain-containing protein n=1 Tax=Aspergillus ibericus CBS 121593 TaxID=1448316 RepID=A0A395H7W9_9EURO|nr:hypothetical protein BO80DRAFT_491832 [Aspergillus ibericus CBS 121593]RAL03603.1 hypothetical protein BO80DRAFT_491832 [Aspergillus ibericus CBS 121593]